MFENLSDRLSGVFGKLTKAGSLSDEDVGVALREVRVALLEADVSLAVARDFVKSVAEKARGQAVTKSVTPGQQVVKIVHDELVRVLAGEGKAEGLRIDSPPAPILMVGLQGSGKTTTTAKLAKRLKERDGKRVLMASLDTRRPAAMEQLAVLGQQVGIDVLPIVAGQDAVAIAKRAKQQATLGGYDVVMLDTAGRLHIDAELMAEVAAVRDATKPHETLLVVDGLTGQDAVNVAEQFDGQIGISGVVLTRMDGDGRGGAALSMRAVTGKPIRFVGLGEKMDALEEFHPERVAGRILGMGDIVGLVERAQETIEAEAAERMMKRFQKGQFNMNDLKGQLEQMLKMGGMQGVMGMLPGMGKMQKQMDEAGFDDRALRRQIALIELDDQEGAAQPRPAAGEPQEAHRRRRRAGGAGAEQAAENAPPDGRRDEEDGGHGQERPAARRLGRAARQGRRHDRRRRDGWRWGPRGAAPRHVAAPGPQRTGAQEVTIPSLSTERLTLRAPGLADFEPYAAFWASDRSIYEGGPRDRAEAWREFACDLACWALRGFGVWSVEPKGGGRWLGAVGLFQPDWFPEPEIGWTLSPEAEGRGVAFEAARAARAWAYSVRGLTTMVSHIDPRNNRSIRLAERLGAWRDADAARPDSADLLYRHPGPGALA